MQKAIIDKHHHVIRTVDSSESDNVRVIHIGSGLARRTFVWTEGGETPGFLEVKALELPDPVAEAAVLAMTVAEARAADAAEEAITTVTISEGQAIRVELRGIDGAFTIDFDSHGDDTLSVYAADPGSVMGDRGIIYLEKFGTPAGVCEVVGLEEAEPVPPALAPAPVAGAPVDPVDLLAQVARLDDTTLWQAARATMTAEQRARMEDLNDKNREQGLDDSEASEQAALLALHTRTLLGRAQAAVMLKMRGCDVSDPAAFNEAPQFPLTAALTAILVFNQVHIVWEGIRVWRVSKDTWRVGAADQPPLKLEDAVRALIASARPPSAYSKDPVAAKHWMNGWREAKPDKKPREGVGHAAYYDGWTARVLRTGGA